MVGLARECGRVKRTIFTVVYMDLHVLFDTHSPVAPMDAHSHSESEFFKIMNFLIRS